MHSGSFGIAGGLGICFGFSFPQIEDVGSDRDWRAHVKTPLLYPHQGCVAKTGLIRQSYRGYFRATIP